MTEEEVLRSKEYREGWNVYSAFKQAGSVGTKPINPYSTDGGVGVIPASEAFSRLGLWAAGAYSAYGLPCPLGMHANREPGTPPLSPLVAEPVQLDLF